MTFWVAIVLFLLMATVHVVGARFFQVWCRRSLPEFADPTLLDPAAILMSIRGVDPFFKNTIVGLIDQNYPDFEIHMVVDGETEPVESLVATAQAASAKRHPTVHVHRLRQPRDTCGRKCSALLEGLEHVDDSVKILAFIDADVVPHRTWLRRLVSPLQDERIGIVSGCLWFEPGFRFQGLVGSRLRQTWNAGSIVPTSMLGNVWAGTMAMRHADFKSAGLREIWSRSIVDDGPIRKAMHQIGLGILVDPRLTMINREACSMGFAFSYIRRLLTWSRWYESTFWNTAIHAAFMLAAWVCSCIAIVQSVGRADATATTVLVSSLVTGLFMYALAYCMVRESVRTTTEATQAMRKTSLVDFLLALLWVPPTHFVFFGGVIGACFFRRIRWRGIDYLVNGPTRVQVLDPSAPVDSKVN
jgi:glycosyltransferase involved in cell wall biosynthesis